MGELKTGTIEPIEIETCLCKDSVNNNNIWHNTKKKDRQINLESMHHQEDPFGQYKQHDQHLVKHH